MYQILRLILNSLREVTNMEMVTTLDIKIRYYDDTVARLVKIETGDWLDLASRIDIDIPENKHELIPLGVSMQLPKGYEAHLAPRSSLFKNTGLIVTNSVGVIDESYCGDNDEWKLSVYCLKGNSFHQGAMVPYTHISAGQRIAQFRIMRKMPPINFIEVQSLNNPDRGGFGSTGNN